MRRSSFAAVRAIGEGLPGVELTTSWGAPTLKVRGRMFVCMATHRSVEPDTLVVRMDMARRDALIEDDPGTYYLKEHYVNYDCVLVRLSRVHPDALRDLVQSAYRYMRDRAVTRSSRKRISPRRTARARRRVE